jgi:hypothetical protein
MSPEPKEPTSTSANARFIPEFRLKSIWCQTFKAKRQTDYFLTGQDHAAARSLLKLPRPDGVEDYPQWLVDVAGRVWDNKQGWWGQRLNSLAMFAAKFNEVYNESKDNESKGLKNNESKPSYQRRVDGNVGTANEGLADQYRDCGKVL